MAMDSTAAMRSAVMVSALLEPVPSISTSAAGGLAGAQVARSCWLAARSLWDEGTPPQEIVKLATTAKRTVRQRM
ncbi:hypothetical protein AB0H12_08750 [Actinosynnema sp. NPDC023794]